MSMSNAPCTTLSPRPRRMFMGGEQFCEKAHECAPGWPDKLLDGEDTLGLVSEGFCPLCPHSHLVPEQPFLGCLDHKTSIMSREEWDEGCREWYGRCPCCQQLYIVKSVGAGPVGVWSTGGIGCDVLWPDGTVS